MRKMAIKWPTRGFFIIFIILHNFSPLILTTLKFSFLNRWDHFVFLSMLNSHKKIGHLVEIFRIILTTLKLFDTDEISYANTSWGFIFDVSFRFKQISFLNR